MGRHSAGPLSFYLSLLGALGRGLAVVAVLAGAVYLAGTWRRTTGTPSLLPSPAGTGAPSGLRPSPSEGHRLGGRGSPQLSPSPGRLSLPAGPTSGVYPAVTVRVLDASGRPALARQVLVRLVGMGYRDGGTGQAVSASSAIFYRPGYEGEARKVAGILGISRVRPASEASLDARAEVTVVIGPDYKG